MGDNNTSSNHSPPPPYTPADTKVPPPNVGCAGYPPAPQFGASGPSLYVPIAPAVISQNPPLPQSVPIISARTALFGPFPVEMDCPFCQNHIVTHTSKVPGVLPWVICVVCTVLGFILFFPWCLCCLPFCIDACLDVIHFCPSCKRLVGKFSRL